MNKLRAIEIFGNEEEALVTIISNKIPEDQHLQIYLLINTTLNEIKHQTKQFEVLSEDRGVFSLQTSYYHTIVAIFNSSIKESEAEQVCKLVDKKWFELIMNPFFNILKGMLTNELISDFKLHVESEISDQAN